jgi:hypothetical protein
MKEDNMYRIFIATLFICISLSSCQKHTESSIREKISAINELQLVVCTMAKTYTLRDAYDKDQENDRFNFINWLEHTVKAGDRIGVYGLRRSYCAYINLNEITDQDVIIKDKTIYLTLPEVQIRVLGNDIMPIVYHERVSGLRFAIDERERLAMRNKATELLDKEIANKTSTLFPSMEKQAKDKARGWFTTMLNDWGYKTVITFKKKES